MSGIHDFTAKSLAGEDIPLKRFEGQVLLIVNTASACGFTPQYRGLEALQEAYYLARRVAMDPLHHRDYAALQERFPRGVGAAFSSSPLPAGTFGVDRGEK